MRIEAILTPAEIARLPERDLNATTCVVFDVLRATSTMLTAFSCGARRVYAVSTVEEARALKQTRLPDALLGGERHGVRLEGFDLGNSPREYTAEVVAGRDIISTTTNGTVALRACDGAKEVLAGAWLNLDVLSAWLLARAASSEHLILVCAGTGTNFAFEDGYMAGGLVARLAGSTEIGQPPMTPLPLLDDAALVLLCLYERAPNDPLTALRRSANGRRLAEIGLEADVERCAETSALPWLARRCGEAMQGEFIKPRQ